MEESVFEKVRTHQCDSCALYVPIYVCLFGEFVEVSNAGSCMQKNSCVTYMAKCVQYYDTCDHWISVEQFKRRKRKTNPHKIALKRIADELVTIADEIKE